MKINFTILIIFLVMAISGAAFAQPTLQWQKNLGGSGKDQANSIKPTSDGGYIVAGQSASADGDITSGHGGIDYWITKLDAAGNIIWQKSYGGSKNDIAKSIALTSDGGFVIAGVSESYDGDITDHGRSYHLDDDFNIDYYWDVGFEPWIVRLDNTGKLLWERTFHTGLGGHHAFILFETDVNTIIQTSDGGFLMGGNGIAFYTDQDWLWGAKIIKLNSDGYEIWEQIFFDGGMITSIVETSTGYTTTGFGMGYFSKGGLDMLVSSFDFNGRNLWEFGYGGSNDDKAYSIQATIDGGYIVAGTTSSTDGDLEGSGNHGAEDYCLLKLNSVGEINWSKCFGGSEADTARAVQQMADGSYVLAGASFSADGQVTDHSTGASAVQPDCWVIKVDNEGNFIWGKSYGGSAADEANTLEKTPDGGLIIAGSSSSTDAGFVNKGDADYWLLKLAFNTCGAVPLPVACNQSFCSCSHPLVSSLKASGTNLKWFNTATGGTALSPVTKLVTGKYYVSQTNVNGCESGRKAIYVTIHTTPPVPDAPPTQVFKKKKSAIVDKLIAYGSCIKWYSSSTGGCPLPLSATLVTGYYYASQTSAAGCESGRTKVSVIVRSHHSSSHKPGDENEVEEDIMTIASVYPNPANSRITIHIKTANTTDNANVQVINAEGKILLQQIILNTKGLVQKTIDVSQLVGGFYIVRYVIGDETGNIKLQVFK